MTYSLRNNCTKNYYNRTLTVQVIAEDDMDVLRHSVVNVLLHQRLWPRYALYWVPFWFIRRLLRTLYSTETRTKDQINLSLSMRQSRFVHRVVVCDV